VDADELRAYKTSQQEGKKGGKSKVGARLSTVCLSMYSITESIYYSQLSSVATLLQPEPVSHSIILFAYQEKIPARNAIYSHAQDLSAGDELLLVILKAFIPQPLNKQ
jgi:hypothetical protein